MVAGQKGAEQQSARQDAQEEVNKHSMSNINEDSVVNIHKNQEEADKAQKRREAEQRKREMVRALRRKKTPEEVEHQLI